MLQIIHHAWPQPSSSGRSVALSVDRITLAKRRWQAAAEDGLSFGFDLEVPLHDGDVIFVTETSRYVLVQKPEPLLELKADDSADAARLGWSLGNLHFPIAIAEGTLHVVDDPAVRLFLERERIPFRPIGAVFRPIRAVAAHGHAH